MSKILLVLLLGGSGLFYWYYNDTQARLADLVENNAKLEIAVQTNEAALKSVQEDLAKANGGGSDGWRKAWAEIKKKSPRQKSLKFKG